MLKNSSVHEFMLAGMLY